METPTPAELEARQLVMEQLGRLDRPAQHRVLTKLQGQITEQEAKIALTQYEIDALKDLLDWWDLPSGSLRLERNEHSRIHKFKEAAKLGLVRQIDKDRQSTAADRSEVFQWLEHTFVVKHDWAGVLDHADGIDSDEIKLPYPICSFEFRVSGRSMIAYTFETEEPPGVGFTVLIESQKLWYSFDDLNGNGDQKGRGLGQFVWEQIRAICISLDAEVATHSVVRAPDKLNEKRAKAGKTPLPSYRVIDLNRKHRIANPVAGSGEGTKKRLHFRRGHWRHYETHKTWIKWCLVGDPALGFIGKHYSL